MFCKARPPKRQCTQHDSAYATDVIGDLLMTYFIYTKGIHHPVRAEWDYDKCCKLVEAIFLRPCNDFYIGYRMKSPINHPID